MHPGKSNCDLKCLHDWVPVLAPETVRPQGDWSIIESSPGVKQWAFRKMPVYTRALDSRGSSLEGSDEPGWHNAYTQLAPPPPEGFTVNDTHSGQVLGDAKGMTIYIYNCNDDAVDQLACNHPDTPQAYRFAVSGRGDPALSLKKLPLRDRARRVRRATAISGARWTSIRRPARRPLATRRVRCRCGPIAIGQSITVRVTKSLGTSSAIPGASSMVRATASKAFWLRDDFGGNAGGSR